MTAPQFNAATETRLVITNLKSCDGRDGIAYSCDVYFDGKHVGKAINSGDGGCTDYWGGSAEAINAADEYATSFAPIDVDGYQIPFGIDMAVAVLCDHADETGRTATN